VVLEKISPAADKQTHSWRNLKMEYIEAKDARRMRGLRLVLGKGNWAVWSECAKNICYVKKIPFVPVAQYGFQENKEIVAWTGVRNQPQAIYDDEPVRTNWYDILMLLERLAPLPALLPSDSETRALVVGLSNELCGEWGLGWCRRLQWSGGSSDDSSMPSTTRQYMRSDYGEAPDAVAKAPARAADIVAMLGRRLRMQREKGSKYFVGGALTAIDVYWACFSNLVEPLPPELCPMSPPLRKFFKDAGSQAATAFDPILIEHRNYIYQNYLKLPVDF
jgi:glutathione S-transferase